MKEDEGIRQCNKCKKILPLNSDNFHQLRVKLPYTTNDWIGFYYQCKSCRNENKREYNKRVKQKTKTYNHNYYRRKKDEAIQEQDRKGSRARDTTGGKEVC